MKKYGFNELKVKLARDIIEESKGKKQIDVNFPFLSQDSHQMIDSKLLDLYEASVQDTYHSIDEEVLMKCVELLHDADIVDIYIHAHNLNIADNFQDKMRTIGRVVNCPKSFYEQRYTAAASKKNHIAILLSYSGKATFLPPIVEMLHRNQVDMILIGRIGNNISKNYIKHHLYISDENI